jgi:malate dehydrogenase (oxaloacetate-decarboxylating)(NADP+)
MAKITKEEALNYHSSGRPGKIEVIPSKPYSTQYDLSLAYSPGVAEPCLEIEKNPDDAYIYTTKCNLVAVISNGTAVLGLGDIGALAGKPVMEGKGLLFKVFADVDVFDIEVDEKDPAKFIEVVKAIAPTFGGINLEDIKAPECFEIETRLKELLNIPVFHDDQHGTAIISGAGLLNAIELVNKKIEDVKVVVNGAGASGIMCARLYISLGVKLENVLMCDTKGVLTSDRTDLNEYKQYFAHQDKIRTLQEAIAGADVFLGLSKAGVLTQDMLRTMAPNPIVFAMANPVPEILYEDAMAVRDDLIFATGRSDYPNQINNVLGFPYIFRGALDVKATSINEEMKIAAVYALANLTKQDVPENVNSAYMSKNLSFGREYIIPKPLDPRLITEVAPAVARAAMETGVARKPITDWEGYKIELMKRMGTYNPLINDLHNKARQAPKRVVFSDADDYLVLKAVQVVVQERIAHPILLGNREEIMRIAKENSLSIEDLPIIDCSDHEEHERRKRYAQVYFDKRQRKGVTFDEAYQKMFDRNFFGVMMVETGDADGFLSGYNTKYPDTIRPALQIVGTNNSLNHIVGMHIVMTKSGPLFFADTTVNFGPTARTLADTALLVANEVRKFNIEPVIAMLSYSNYGSVRNETTIRVKDAVEYLHVNYPDLIVDGEIQANFAFNKELRMKKFPFSKLGDREVNTIIFPNLSSGNVAYKMMIELGHNEVIGPVLLGMRKPVHVLQLQSTVREIVNMTAITVVDAQIAKDDIIML